MTHVSTSATARAGSCCDATSNATILSDGRRARRSIGRRPSSGRPLPKGRYTARSIGGDRAGNRGRCAPLRIWVSGDASSGRSGARRHPGGGARLASATLHRRRVRRLPAVRRPSCRAPGSPRASAIARPTACRARRRPTVPRRTHILAVAEATGVRGGRQAGVGSPVPRRRRARRTPESWPSRAGVTALGCRASRRRRAPRPRGSRRCFGGAGASIEDYDDTAATVPAGVRWSFATRGHGRGRRRLLHRRRAPPRRRRLTPVRASRGPARSARPRCGWSRRSCRSRRTGGCAPCLPRGAPARRSSRPATRRGRTSAAPARGR